MKDEWEKREWQDRESKQWTTVDGASKTGHGGQKKQDSTWWARDDRGAAEVVRKSKQQGEGGKKDVIKAWELFGNQLLFYCSVW